MSSPAPYRCRAVGPIPPNRVKVAEEPRNVAQCVGMMRPVPRLRPRLLRCDACGREALA